MTTTIQAKFTCYSAMKTAAGTTSDGAQKYAETVTFNPVSGPENKPWSEYTPSGRLEMCITNPGAQGVFQPGKAYLLTFEEAPPA